jgi:glycosyltransferase involved in cell wall biosynthesis
MRITQIVAPGDYGGLERVVVQLCAGLVRRGHEVTCIVIAEQGGRPVPVLVGDLTAAGVRIELLRVPHRAYLKERREVHSLLSSIRPAVAHTHGYHADVLLRSVAQDLAIPTLATLHGFTGGSNKNRAFEWLQCRSARQMDAVIAVSRPLADRLSAQGVDPARIRVIRNAWAAPGAFLARAEARDRLRIRPEELAIGWVGRLTHEKGPDQALETVPRLPDPVRLHFLGSGDMEPGLRRRARELHVETRVEWHGVVPGAWSYLPAFDACCLSSRTEGTPIILLEAMSARVPIVATRVGGVPDVVSEAEALLVPAGQPEELAAALGKAITDSQEQRVAAAARRVAAEFGVDRWLDAYEAVYSYLARKKVVS